MSDIHANHHGWLLIQPFETLCCQTMVNATELNVEFEGDLRHGQSNERNRMSITECFHISKVLQLQSRLKDVIFLKRHDEPVLSLS
jgi:hypothetical protein